MNKFFKILGKVTFIGLIAETVIYGIFGIVILMEDKFGLHNGFTECCDTAMSGGPGRVYHFFGQLFDRR